MRIRAHFLPPPQQSTCNHRRSDLGKTAETQSRQGLAAFGNTGAHNFRTIRSVNHAYNAHRTGSQCPARPAQLSDASLGLIDGGIDPQKVSEMSHSSAMALLHRVRTEQDPVLVERVLTLVDREGLDLIAELWAKSEPDTLPGVMWRLYLLRDWMRTNASVLPHFWSLGEPSEGAASAITGIDEYPHANDIISTADSILSGTFTGDFAVALDRAAVFVDVVCRGMERRAQSLLAHAESQADASGTSSSSSTSGISNTSAAREAAARQQCVRLRESAAHLLETSHQFRRCAELWRQNKLD